MSKKENGTKLNIMKPGDHPEARRAPRGSQRRTKIGHNSCPPAERLTSFVLHLQSPKLLSHCRGRRRAAEEGEGGDDSSSHLLQAKPANIRGGTTSTKAAKTLNFLMHLNGTRTELLAAKNNNIYQYRGRDRLTARFTIGDRHRSRTVR